MKHKNIHQNVDIEIHDFPLQDTSKKTQIGYIGKEFTKYHKSFS